MNFLQSSPIGSSSSLDSQIKQPSSKSQQEQYTSRYKQQLGNTSRESTSVYSVDSDSNNYQPQHQQFISAEQVVTSTRKSSNQPSYSKQIFENALNNSGLNNEQNRKFILAASAAVNSNMAPAKNSYQHSNSSLKIPGQMNMYHHASVHDQQMLMMMNVAAMANSSSSSSSSSSASLSSSSSSTASSDNLVQMYVYRHI